MSIIFKSYPKLQILSRQCPNLYFRYHNRSLTSFNRCYKFHQTSALNISYDSNKCKSILFKDNITVNSSFTRTFMSFIRKKSKHQIQKEDGVPSDYEIVGKTDSFNYVKYGAVSFYSFNIISITTVLLEYFEITSLDLLYALQVTPLQTFAMLSFSIFCGVINMAFQRWYPARFYYSEDSDKFLVVMMSPNPFKNRLLEVNPGECKHLKFNQLLTNVLGNSKDMIVQLKQQFVIVNVNDFQFPLYYNKLFGYK